MIKRFKRLHYELGKNKIFVFDVESNTLFGEGFAVGACVYSYNQTTLEPIHTFELMSEEEIITDKWMIENVIPHLKDMPKCKTNLELRNKFFNFYMEYREDSLFFADCCFPVETNFLSAVANDDIEKRRFKMPYPLLDIANERNIDMDREEYYNRKNAYYILQDVANRHPKKHNPLWDSICSAFFLMSHSE
jgi:hypothetical protein